MCYIKKCYFDVSLLSQQRDITEDRRLYLKAMEKNLRSKEDVLSSIDKNILSLLESERDIINEVTESSDNHTYLHKTLTLLEVVFHRLVTNNDPTVLSCIKENPHLEHVVGEHLKKRSSIYLEATRRSSSNNSLHGLANPVVKRRQIVRVNSSARQEKRYTFPAASHLTLQSYLLEKWTINRQNSIDASSFSSSRRHGYTSHEAILDSRKRDVFMPAPLPSISTDDGGDGAAGCGEENKQRFIETTTVYTREKCEKYVVKETRSILKDNTNVSGKKEKRTLFYFFKHVRRNVQKPKDWVLLVVLNAYSSYLFISCSKT